MYFLLQMFFSHEYNTPTLYLFLSIYKTTFIFNNYERLILQLLQARNTLEEKGPKSNLKRGVGRF